MRLSGRIQKLEKELLPPDSELIISIFRFGSPQGKETPEHEKYCYPPIDEQIAEQREAGKDFIIVFEYAGQNSTIAET